MTEEGMEMKTESGKKIFRVLAYVFMASCVIVALFPIFWVILSSFKTNKIGRASCRERVFITV